ncbi:MAG: hypothetical protein V4657_13195 [Pseudomonadota bacterium]
MTHKEKMIERRKRQNARRPDTETYAYANVGRAHPDYGLHPHEHAKRKAARVSSK